ncbi:hypothetical protein ABZ897_22880 [Nonomuraea sp. NPDC046802]|uniref:hypothetical protein n=1 Tax=Nonomuraea sp. NPDC046802 TaxID=3154919 RepID=UPI0033E28D68
MARSDELFRELAALLPPEDTATVTQDMWGIGECENAISELCLRLVQHRIPITESTRGWIAALAERHGYWEYTGPDNVPELLPECVTADEQDAPWTLIERTRRGFALTEQIKDAVGPGHPLHDAVDLAAWYACHRCGDVLVGLYDRERFLAVFAPQFAIVRSSNEVSTFESIFDALDALTENCAPAKR